MTLPPHLPPPTCSVSQHRSWQNLKVILVATFFGMIAGVAGAAVVSVSISQNFSFGTSWVIASHGAATLTLDKSIVKRISGTVFTVYGKASTLGGVSYFDGIDRLGDGVIGVSSGWLVLPLTNYTGTFKDWRILSPDQEVYRADRVLYDKEVGLAYIRMVRLTVLPQTTQEQFKVAPFYTSLSLPTDVFVLVGGQWLPTTLVSSKVVRPSHLETVPAKNMQVVGNFAPGSLAIDAAGSVVGFVREANTLTPAFAVDNVLTNIDERTSITYPTWGVEGWFSDEKPLLVNGELQNGFLVVKVNGSSLLKRGDIILTVNGRPADFATVWYTMNDSQSTVVVLRNGKQVALRVTRRL